MGNGLSLIWYKNNLGVGNGKKSEIKKWVGRRLEEQYGSAGGWITDNMVESLH